jgi:hypothetical protein
MAQEFDEVDDDTVYMIISPRKLRKWDVIAVGLQGISAVAGVVSDMFRDSAGLLLRHSEYEQMMTNIHQQAAFELETILEQVSGEGE